MKLKNVKKEVKGQLKLLGIEDLARFVENFPTNKSLESFIFNKTKIKRKEVLLHIQRELVFRDYLDKDKLYFLQIPKTVNELGSIEDLDKTVISALPEMLLNIDPDKTFFKKSAEEWLMTYKKALLTEYYKFKSKKAYKKVANSLDKKYFVDELLKDKNPIIKTLAKRVPLYYIYLYTKRDKYIDLYEYLLEYVNKKLYKKAEKFSKEVTTLYPQLEQITYESMVKDYFGIEYKEGIKLHKQLKRAKKEFKDKELVFFGETRKWFNSIKKRKSSMNGDYRYSGQVFIDKSSYKIPNNVDEWAFRDSCNNSSSPVGRDTHIVLSQLGFEYIRLFGMCVDTINKEVHLTPLARAYFVDNHEGIAHAGGYTNVVGENFFHTSYEFWTVLLCILRGHKVDDFSNVGGFEGGSRKYYREGDVVRIYSNMGAECGYTKLATSREVLNIVSCDYNEIKETCDLYSLKEKQEPELTFKHTFK